MSRIPIVASLVLMAVGLFGLPASQAQSARNFAKPVGTGEPPLLKDPIADVKSRVKAIKKATPLPVETRSGDTQTGRFIVGGQVAAEGQFPHCVALGFANGNSFSHCCTGTLIGPNVIVSAAHCAEGGCAPSHVFFGVHSNKPSIPASQIYEVAHVIIKREYRTTQEGNDIALIILKKEVTGVTPCPVAVASEIRANAELVLAGFGQTSNGSSGVLNFVKVALTNPSCSTGSAGGASCASGLEFATINNDGRDTCYGDSGGPAYVVRGNGLAVAGATSRGSRVCGSLGIYTRVDVHVPWIVSVAKEFGGVLPAGFGNGTLPGNGGNIGLPCESDITAIMIRDRLGRWKLEYPEIFNKALPGQ